jgi:hypothetical protein
MIYIEKGDRADRLLSSEDGVGISVQEARRGSLKRKGANHAETKTK